MKMNVNWHLFESAFDNCGRYENFGYEALYALFNYLEDLEQDIGEEIELDVVALCCEYRNIEDDEEEYSQYVGENATRQEYIIAELPCSVLVREG